MEDKSWSDSIILGDDEAHSVDGRGNVLLGLEGIPFISQSVLCIPSLKRILLSISEISNQCPTLDVIFKEGDKCFVVENKTGKLLASSVWNMSFTDFW